MNPVRARKRIRELTGAGRWELTEHAVTRMVQRGFGLADVRKVLLRAPVCYESTAGRWRLEGEAMTGEALTLIAEIEAGVIVVTLFGGDDE